MTKLASAASIKI